MNSYNIFQYNSIIESSNILLEYLEKCLTDPTQITYLEVVRKITNLGQNLDIYSDSIFGIHSKQAINIISLCDQLHNSLSHFTQNLNKNNSIQVLHDELDRFIHDFKILNDAAFYNSNNTRPSTGKDI